jgi:hypothetical protein
MHYFKTSWQACATCILLWRFVSHVFVCICMYNCHSFILMKTNTCRYIMVSIRLYVFVLVCTVRICMYMHVLQYECNNALSRRHECICMYCMYSIYVLVYVCWCVFECQCICMYVCVCMYTCICSGNAGKMRHVWNGWHDRVAGPPGRARGPRRAAGPVAGRSFPC